MNERLWRAYENPICVDKANIALHILYNDVTSGDVKQFESDFILLSRVFPPILDQRHFELVNFNSSNEIKYPVTRLLIVALSILGLTKLGEVSST